MMKYPAESISESKGVVAGAVELGDVVCGVCDGASSVLMLIRRGVQQNVHREKEREKESVSLNSNSIQWK